MQGQKSRKARVRVAKRDDTQEKHTLLLALLFGGAIIATAALGKLLLMSP